MKNKWMNRIRSVVNSSVEAPPNNILLIDKPSGISSFDVIRILRKKLGARKPGSRSSTGFARANSSRTFTTRKMGHAGTLDPLASGLLIVGIGEGTKKLRELIGLPKTYEMEILLGLRTDTGDMEGRVVDEANVGDVGINEVKEVLRSLEGEVELAAPIYSALKVKGVPMYRLARRGEKIEPKKRKMMIYSLKFLGTKKRDVQKLDGKFVCIKAELHCGSGTYARSVAEEVGRRLGLPATVYSLRRTKVGDFMVEDAERLP